MRIGSYRSTNSEVPWCGVSLDDQRLVHLQEADETLPHDATELLELPDWQAAVDAAVEHAHDTGDGIYHIDAVDPAPPIPNPPKIVCVGLNYRDHAEEGGNQGRCMLIGWP